MENFIFCAVRYLRPTSCTHVRMCVYETHKHINTHTPTHDPKAIPLYALLKSLILLIFLYKDIGFHLFHSTGLFLCPKETSEN